MCNSCATRCSSVQHLFGDLPMSVESNITSHTLRSMLSSAHGAPAMARRPLVVKNQLRHVVWHVGRRWVQAHLNCPVVRSGGYCSTRRPLPTFNSLNTCGRWGAPNHQLDFRHVQLGAALVQLGAARWSGFKVVEEAPPRPHKKIISGGKREIPL